MNFATSTITRWWWERHEQERRTLRRVGVALAAVLLLGLWARHEIQGRLQVAESRLSQLEADDAARAAAPPAAPRTDFTAAWPARLRTDEVVRDATAWAGRFDLLLPVLSIRPAATAPGQLQQSGIVAELRGSYPNIKLWLRELLARYPELALLSLDIQRAAEPGAATLSANVQLRLYARPEPAAPTPGAPR